MFRFSVKFNPELTPTIYNNTVSVSAKSPSLSSVSDDSVDGTDVDPDSDDDRTNNSSVTPVTYPRIATRKVLDGTPSVNVDGSYDVKFKVFVKNTGTQDLSSVSANDILEGAYPKFGTYTPTEDL